MKKQLGITGLHLNQFGKTRLAINHILLIKKLCEDMGYMEKYIKQKLFDSAKNSISKKFRNILEKVEEALLMFLNKICLILIGLEYGILNVSCIRNKSEMLCYRHTRGIGNKNRLFVSEYTVFYRNICLSI